MPPIALAAAAGALCLSCATAAHSYDKLGLPKVEDVATETVEERGESDIYIRLPDNTLSGWWRGSTGVNVRLGAAGEQPQTCFAFGVYGGVELGWDRTSAAAVVVEAGYSYVYGGQHWLLLGAGPTLRRLGPSFGSDADEPLRPIGAFQVAFVPHAIVGSYEGEWAAGARLSLLARFSVMALTLAYQGAAIPAADRTTHEIHLSFGSAVSQWDLQ